MTLFLRESLNPNVTVLSLAINDIIDEFIKLIKNEKFEHINQISGHNYNP